MYHDSNQHNTQVKTMGPFKTNSNKKMEKSMKVNGFYRVHIWFLVRARV